MSGVVPVVPPLVRLASAGSLAEVASHCAAALGACAGVAGHGIALWAPRRVRLDTVAGTGVHPGQAALDAARRGVPVEADGVLWLPLSSGGRVVGVLGVREARAGALDAVRAELDTIAGLTALACARTRRGERAGRGPSVSVLLDMVPEAIVAVGLDGNILYGNVGAQLLTGFSEQAAVGQPVSLLLGERFATAVAAGLPGDPGARGHTFEAPLTHADGHEIPVEVTVRRVDDEVEGAFHVAALRDVTDRRRADAERARTDERGRRFATALLAMSRGAIEDLAAFEQQVCAFTAAALGVERVAVWRFQPPGMRCRAQYDARTRSRGLPEPVSGRVIDAYVGTLGARDAVVAPDAAAASATAAYWSVALQPHGIRAVLDVPLRLLTETRGLLSVQSAAPRAWLPAEVAFVREVAALLVQAVERGLRRRLEARHAAILASVSDAVIACDTAGRVTLVNPVAAALTGWPAAEAVGRPVAEVFRTLEAGTRAPRELPVAAIASGAGSPAPAYGAVLLRRDGGELPIADCAAPIVESGAIRGVVLTFRDVTDELRARREVELQNRRFRSVGEALPDPLYSVTLDGRVRDWRSGGDDTVPLRDRFPAWAADALQAAAARAVASRSVQTVEYAAEGPGLGLIEARLAPMGDDEVTLLVRDVTESRAQVEQLAEERERLATLLASTSAIIYAARLPDFRIEYVSESALAVLGYTVEEFSAPGFWESHVHPEDRDRVMADLGLLFAHGRHQHEYRHRHRLGHYVWLRDEVRLVRDAAGVPVRAIGASFDISSRKLDEGRLSRVVDIRRVISSVSRVFLESRGAVADGTLALALETLGAQLHARRAHLYASDGTRLSNTGEWCAEGVAPCRAQRQDIPVAAFEARAGALVPGRALRVTGRVEGRPPSVLDAPDGSPTYAAPVIVDGVVRGVLCVDGPEVAPLEDEEFMAMLQILADAVAAGLQRAEDEDALRRLNERITLRGEQKRALLDLSTDLARTNSRALLLAKLRRNLKNVLKHDMVSFLELDPTSGRYRMRVLDDDAVDAVTPELPPIAPLELRGTAIAHALASGRPVTTREHGPTAFSDWATLHARHGYRQFVVVPMIGASGAFGTLNLASNRDAPPSVEQIDWTAQCAAMLAAHLSKQQAQDQLLGLNQQLEERVEARTAELRASDARFQTLFLLAPQAMVIVDADGRVVQSNGSAQRLFGFDAAGFAGVPVARVIPEGAALFGGAAADAPQVVPCARADGSSFLAEIGLVPIQLNGAPHTLAGLTNVSDRVHAQAELTQSLREKETLLMEIHHRVKNNLQIISSLLMLQSQQMPSDEARTMLEESVLRVRSMALIHQQLYGAESLARVDLGSYARTLAESVRTTYAPSARVLVKAELAEVTVERAVPVGLMLNELLTNAFKYGVPQSRPDTGEPWDVLIEVEVVDGALRLAVTDHGPGLPPGFDPATSTTLGLQLVRSLTRQLRGRFVASGSRFELTCPPGRAA